MTTTNNRDGFDVEGLRLNEKILDAISLGYDVEFAGNDDEYPSYGPFSCRLLKGNLEGCGHGDNLFIALNNAIDDIHEVEI